MNDFESYLDRVKVKWAAEGGADTAHDLAHIRRVHVSARALVMGHNVDLDVLDAAVAFHDAVNLPKDHPERAKASVMAAGWAVSQVPNWTQFRRDALHHAIAAHSFSAGVEPRSLEAKILRDADRLDAVGAIGIARMFAVSGALNRPLYDENDPFAAQRPLDDTRFAVDHFAVKLLRLETGMCTEAGRAMAKARCDEMRAYLRALAKEIGWGSALPNHF